MDYNLQPSRDALFLDVDGTLLDIADSPENVSVSPDLVKNLSRLHKKLNGALALISGRTINNLDALFEPLQLPAAGIHGAEFREDNKSKIVADQSLPGDIRDVIFSKLDPYKYHGLLIEDKVYAIAVHYRNAPEMKSIVEAALTEIVIPSVTILKGKMVYEIVLSSNNKGAALERFLTFPHFTGMRPVFIGDDVTDISAIDVCQRKNGITVRVGTTITRATYAFSSPACVRSWIETQAT